MYQNIQLCITGVESIPLILYKFDRGDHFSFAQSQAPSFFYYYYYYHNYYYYLMNIIFMNINHK